MDKDSKITDTAAETEAEDSQPETPGATRRRLLKAGAASVPVMITVGSSSVFGQPAGGVLASSGCYSSLDPEVQNFIQGSLATDAETLVDKVEEEFPNVTLSISCARSILTAGV